MASARKGRDIVVQFVIDTTRQLPHITGWWPRNGAAGAEECGIGGGKKGASYSYAHWAPQGKDVHRDAQSIADYWRTLGMTVRVDESTVSPTVYGEGGPVLRASFDTAAVPATAESTTDSYRIGALMPCAPGDAYTLNYEDHTQRQHGKTLPGDEGIIISPDSHDPDEVWPTPEPTE